MRLGVDFPPGRVGFFLYDRETCSVGVFAVRVGDVPVPVGSARMEFYCEVAHVCP